MSDIIMPVIESVMLAINIDEKSNTVIHAVQSDHMSRVIRGGFADKEIDYILDLDAKVDFLIIRPDGILKRKACTIDADGNYCEVYLDEELLSVPGNARAGFLIWDKDKEQSIRSQEFTLHIGEKLDKDENIPTNADVPIAKQVTANTQAIEALKAFNGVEIVSQPSNINARTGYKIAFNVVAKNAVTYQWQYRTAEERAAGWYSSSATGSKTDTLHLTVSSNNSKNVYRCKITGGPDGKTIYTDEVRIVIDDTLPETQPSDEQSNVDLSAIETEIANIKNEMENIPTLSNLDYIPLDPDSDPTKNGYRPVFQRNGGAELWADTSREQLAIEFIKADLSNLKNSEMAETTGKVWGTTADGAGWIDAPTGGSGGLTESQVNGLIDAKLTPLEALADDILEVI